jgi:MscS family membrane protein
MKVDRDRCGITNKVQRWKFSKLLVMACLAIFVGFMTMVIAGCQGLPGTPLPSPSPSLTSSPTITPVPPTSQPDENSLQPTEEQVLATPTLAPTATPSPIDFAIEDLTENIGIDDLTILGLNGEDLVNLLVSILIILVGSFLGVLFVNVLVWLAKYTPPTFDDRLLGRLENQLKWLIILIFLQMATTRLAFLSPELKQWLNLIYFALYVLVIAVIVWKLVDYGLEGPLLQVSSPENRNVVIAFAPLLSRLAQVLIFIVSLAIILEEFGFNLSALLAVLGLGGLAISLAAKETLEDMINGFIILIDRPFQIGDRIKIETMDDWGDVEDIGSRTTKIRTLDDRLVIVPNSVIGNSQIINFTDPDPKFRVDITLGIGYGYDIDHVIETIINAISSVENILKDPAPFVRLIEFGDSAIIFRAYYWLKSYKDIQIKTIVNKAIYQAITEANIDMPFITYDVNLSYKESPPEEKPNTPPL